MSRFCVLIFSMCLLWANLGRASEPRFDAFAGCGEYLVQGHLRLEGATAVLDVLKGTVNEYHLDLANNWPPRVMSYLDQAVTLHGLIRSQLPGHQGVLEMANAKDQKMIGLAIISPLEVSRGHAFALLRPAQCK